MNLRAQILADIKSHPSLDAVQISENTQASIDDVNAALRDMVAAGEILKERIPGVTGSRSYVFTVNPTHVGWKVSATSEAIATPVEAGPKPTKVQIAIDYLRDHPASTSEQIRKAMGVSDKYSPGQYLGTALKRGLIVRAGDLWSLPKAAAVPTPALPIKKSPKQSTTKSKPSATPAVKREIAVVPTKRKTSIQAVQTSPFSCGLFSNGELTINSADAYLTLSPDHTKQLVSYLTRMKELL